MPGVAMLFGRNPRQGFANATNLSTPETEAATLRMIRVANDLMLELYPDHPPHAPPPSLKSDDASTFEPDTLSLKKKQIALVWDCDETNGLDLPPGIINSPGVGSKNGGPGTGHGATVNIYSGAVFPGERGAPPIPQQGNVSIHVASLTRYLPTLIPDVTFEGICLVDFESMRADWNSTTPTMHTLSVQLAGNDTKAAREQYEAAARVYFEATIATIRTLRPGCKIGWYGYPGGDLPHVPDTQWLDYCAAHYPLCWFDSTGSGAGYQGPGAAAMRDINDGLGWLFKLLDVITPSVYLGIAPKPPSTRAVGPLATETFVGSVVREAVRLGGKAGTLVVPIIWMNYDNFWDKSINHSAPRALLTAEDAAIELGAPLRNGADGVLIWGHLDNTTSNSTNNLAAYQRFSGSVLKETVASICANYSCCASLHGCF